MERDLHKLKAALEKTLCKKWEIDDSMYAIIRQVDVEDRYSVNIVVEYEENYYGGYDIRKTWAMFLPKIRDILNRYFGIVNSSFYRPSDYGEYQKRNVVAEQLHKYLNEAWNKNPDPKKMELIRKFLTGKTFSVTKAAYREVRYECRSSTNTIHNMRFKVTHVKEIKPHYWDDTDYQISMLYEFIDGKVQKDYSIKDHEDWDPNGETYEIEQMDKDEDYGIISQVVEAYLTKLLNRYFSCRVAFFINEMTNSANYIPD